MRRSLRWTVSALYDCRRQAIPLLPCLFEKLTHRRVKAESPASVCAELYIVGTALEESHGATSLFLSVRPQTLPQQRSERVTGRDKPEERMSFLSEQACPGQ
jgi:hypothetical protein